MLGLALGFCLLGVPAPEGVASFTAGDIEFQWSGVYWLYSDAADNSECLRVGTGGNACWEVFGDAFPEEWSFPYVAGVCPIRSQTWAEHGYTITAVKNADGSEWIDPQTGYPWGWSPPSDPPGDSIVPEAFVLWGDSIGSMIALLGLICGGLLGLLLGVRVANRGRREVSGAVGLRRR